MIDRTGLETPLPLEDIKKQLKMHPLVMIPGAGAGIALSHAARTPLVLLYPDQGFRAWRNLNWRNTSLPQGLHVWGGS